MTYEFKPAEFHASVIRGQNFVSATELFRQNGHVTRGQLSLQHVCVPTPLYSATEGVIIIRHPFNVWGVHGF